MTVGCGGLEAAIDSKRYLQLAAVIHLRWPSTLSLGPASPRAIWDPPDVHCQLPPRLSQERLLGAEGPHKAVASQPSLHAAAMDRGKGGEGRSEEAELGCGEGVGQTSDESVQAREVGGEAVALGLAEADASLRDAREGTRTRCSGQVKRHTIERREVADGGRRSGNGGGIREAACEKQHEGGVRDFVRIRGWLTPSRWLHATH